MALTRRTVLRNGWRAGGALLATAAGWTVFDSLRPLASGNNKGSIDLGNASDFGEGTSTYVPAGRLFVTNAGGEIFALSQRCPHLGCRVPFCESSGRFECGCHGSMFDLGGEWIKGPSPRGMDRYRVTVVGDALTVDTATTIKGPAHGAKAYLSAPKGPNCAGKA